MSFVSSASPDFTAWVWLGLGLTFGRGFGKQLDQTIKKSEWFRSLEGWQQWLVSRILDVAHHWWIGALLMIYWPRAEACWFSAGLFLDDLPDVP